MLNNCEDAEQTKVVFYLRSHFIKTNFQEVKRKIYIKLTENVGGVAK